MIFSVPGIIFGLLIGLLLFTRVVRWLGGMWEIIRRRHDTPVTLKTAGTSIFLHDGPWLLLLSILSTVWLFSSEHRPEWIWLFAGIALTPFAATFIIVRALRRRERGKARAAV